PRPVCGPRGAATGPSRRTMHGLRRARRRGRRPADLRWSSLRLSLGFSRAARGSIACDNHRPWAPRRPAGQPPARRELAGARPLRVLPEAGLRALGLEELDRVARRVLEQDLVAADADDDLVAEARAGGAQLVDHPLEVVDLQ